MKAAIFEEHGGPEVIRLAEVPRPEPGPGEVRIRVRASSLNHLDLWARRGLPIPIAMPHVGGSDIAGEVDALGPGVQGIERGSRVVVDPTLGWEWFEGVRGGAGLPDPEFRLLGEHLQGGFAEYVVAPAANLLGLPDHVSWQTAAGAALVAVTAWRGLVVRGGIRPGQRVLITGGSGGVATMAIQIARRAGARVFTLTSGPENCRRLTELGAHVAIDRLAGPPRASIKEATGKAGVDLILDSVGGELWGTLIRALAPGGRLVCYGATAGAAVETDLRYIFWKQLSVHGSTMGSPAEFRAAMEFVFEGRLAPVIQAALPLAEVGRAHELLEGGQVFGKIVIDVPG